MANEIKKEWVIMENEIRTEHAIQTLKPNAKFLLRGDVLEWLDSEQTEPTKSELAKEVTRLQGIYDNNVYQRNRANEYPEIKEQLDLLYKDMLSDKGDKTGAWFAAVKTVKDKYSKG